MAQNEPGGPINSNPILPERNSTGHAAGGHTSMMSFCLLKLKALIRSTFRLLRRRDAENPSV